MILIQNLDLMNNTKEVSTVHVCKSQKRHARPRIRQTAQVKQMWSLIKGSKKPNELKKT